MSDKRFMTLGDATLTPIENAKAEISRLTQRVAELEYRLGASRPLGDAEFVKDQLAIILKERNDLGIRLREHDAELLSEQRSNSQMRQRVAELEQKNADVLSRDAPSGQCIINDLKDRLIIAMKERNDLALRLTAVMDAAERERASLFLALDSADARAMTAKAELAHLRELIDGLLADNPGQTSNERLDRLHALYRNGAGFCLCKNCSWPFTGDACDACGMRQPREIGPVAEKEPVKP